MAAIIELVMIVFFVALVIGVWRIYDLLTKRGRDMDQILLHLQNINAILRRQERSE